MASRASTTASLNGAIAEVIDVAGNANAAPNALADAIAAKNNAQMLKSCVDTAFQQA